MTRREISSQIRAAQTLTDCYKVSQLLRDYLQLHPDDDDLRDEGSSLYMKMTALEQTGQASLSSVVSRTEHAAGSKIKAEKSKL